MKKFFAISFMLFAFHAGAANKVPDGTYVGKGVWSDTTGASGVLDIVYTANGYTGYNRGDLNNGTIYEGSFTYNYSTDSNYSVVAGTTPIGTGVASPSQYSTDMYWSPTLHVQEQGSFNGTTLVRYGTIANTETNVTTFYNVEMTKTN